MQELKVCFNNRDFFFLLHRHIQPPPVSESVKRIVGSREAEALGHKEDFS